MEEYLGIKLQIERDNLFDSLGIKRLKESYMKSDEASPQEQQDDVYRVSHSKQRIKNIGQIAKIRGESAVRHPRCLRIFSQTAELRFAQSFSGDSLN